MKKWLVATTFLLVVGLMYQHEASAKVIWDKSEVVERQSGKLSFKKDVKVYKKIGDGTFTSMISKKDNFFRVYDIEKYNGKVFYWMSSGYRVEATDLVNFKAVPMQIRASFYDAPGYIMTNQDGYRLKDNYLGQVDTATFFGRGTIISSYYYDIPSHEEPEDYSQILSFDKEYLLVSRINTGYYKGGRYESGRIHGTDIKVVPRQLVPSGEYSLKKNTVLYSAPLANSKTTTLLKEGTKIVAFYSEKVAINGYIPVQRRSEDVDVFDVNTDLDDTNDYVYIPVSSLIKN